MYLAVFELIALSTGLLHQIGIKIFILMGPVRDC